VILHRLIEWFAGNRIAANLLMVFILAAGLVSIPRLKEEVFPEFSSDVITVTVEFLGASPEEVEEGVCLRVEEAVYGLGGVKRVTSTAAEGLGTTTIEILPGTENADLLNRVKSRIDAIDTFPADTERPIVEELVLKRQVIDVAIYGDTDERSLRTVAERVRDDIADLPEISLVKLANARPYEISIEVSEEALRRHHLSFDDVVRAVRRSSLDLPGGSVKTEGGQILLRTKGQAYRGQEFEEIPLISRPDGTRVLLGEVGKVVDAFEDTEQVSYFDGKPVVLLQVFRVGEQGAMAISETVRSYVTGAEARLEEGIEITTWQDDAAVLKSRLHLLVDNGLMGLALVCVSLALFLRFKLACWVAWGIPISFLGCLWLLPLIGVSINLISLFAFLVVLGLVVDDAIIVGESIFTQIESGRAPIEAAVDGTKKVALPVVFAVMTSVAAFAPLLTIPGNTGKVMKIIPGIVIATLLFSVIESLFILPTHLSHLHTKPSQSLLATAWARLQALIALGLARFIERVYNPLLEAAIGARYLTVAIGLAALILTVAYAASGRVKFVFFPEVDADNAVVLLTMPQGTSADITTAAVRKIERAAIEVLGELDTGTAPIFQHVVSSIGGQPFKEAQSLRRGRRAILDGSHLGEVNVELIPAEERSITATEFAQRWRERVGSIPDAVELTFTSSLFSTGEPINIELSSAHSEGLRLAANDLKRKLLDYAGVIDITDSHRAGKQELRLGIQPQAEALGLSLSDVARQVRQGFYGEEAQRVQRGRDDVRVMVRYPVAERRSLSDLENIRVRTSSGAEVPFLEVATVDYGRGYASIQRADRQRIVNVTANIAQDEGNANEVLRDLKEKTLPELVTTYPGLSYALEGEQREQRETLGGLVQGFLLAMVLIYGLLAIPFHSYLQPLIVMSAIPFGLVGVVWGHVIMGLPLTFLSLFGFVALTGVVVNDSLILVDFVNRVRAEGLAANAAVRQAGAARFRAIFLTSLTTFAGLTPLLLEKSMQAQFLIPMAASLAFGVLFATFVTLLLVPVSYVILEDLMRAVPGRKGPSS
jgi:multidrug efflux pump subunit AcrB